MDERPNEGRTATEQPREPETVREIDPDVARLLGLRPLDAGPLPTADEFDTDHEPGRDRIASAGTHARRS